MKDPPPVPGDFFLPLTHRAGQVAVVGAVRDTGTSTSVIHHNAFHDLFPLVPVLPHFGHQFARAVLVNMSSAGCRHVPCKQVMRNLILNLDI